MSDDPQKAPGADKEERDEEALQLARTVPYWFLAIIGSIYASGFLVVTTHLERYGIREVGGDVWKSRYVHIGVLSGAFPAMIIGTIFGLLYVYSLRLQEPSDNRPSNAILIGQALLSGLSIVMLELAFYGFVVFARESRQRTSEGALATLLAMMLVVWIVLSVVGWIEHRGGQLHPVAVRWTFVPRAGVLVAVTWLFIIVFSGYWDRVSEMYWYRGRPLALLVSFLAGMGYSIYRFWKLPPTRRAASRILIICVLGPMYYLALTGFAYSIFAYIPAARNGGDYTDSPLVTISLKGGSVLAHARLVEETSDSLYLADKSEDPCRWRIDLRARPKLRAISRAEIQMIDYDTGVDVPIECAAGGAAASK